jgi:nucleoside-diphosphate kinase
MSDIQLAFECDWYDPVTGLLNKLYIKFFTENKTIEILTDVKIFLSRIFCPGVVQSDFFIGNSVTIYNRLYNIRAYANVATENYMKAREERFVVVVAKSGMKNVSKVVDTATKYGLVVGRIRTASSSSRQDVPFESCIVECIGGATSKKGFAEACNGIGPSVYSSVMPLADINILLAAQKSIAVPENCTLCLVKPHVMRSKRLGEILDAITGDGFELGAMMTFHMTLAMTEEFLDDYRGTLSIGKNYCIHTEYLSSAPVLAIMITGSDQVLTNFREFTGPQDPSLAKTLRQKSLRAVFGADRTKNALHCTDLEGDGAMECKYFFDTLVSL